MVFSKILPLLLLSFASALWQYDFCELANGDVGQCLHILDCPAAQEDLKKRIRPRICGYDGLYTIVCCKLCESPLEILPTPSPTTHFNQPTTFQKPHTIQPVESRGQLTTTTSIDINNVTQQPVTQAMPSSSSLVNIKNLTQQPDMQAMPTSQISSTSVDSNNGPFTSALKTQLPIATTEAPVNTTESLSSSASPLTTEQPLIQISSAMTTDDPSSATEELSEKKCQEYVNVVIPTTPAPFGFANLHQFVVGGVRAAHKQFPHMAALGYGEDGQFAWQCGGSLISEQFVLTAAHCLFSRNLGDVRTVRLGELDIYATYESTERQEFNVTDTYPHPDYTSTSHYNDIALLKLDRPVIFSEFVSPACLQRDININEALTTTGWGAEEFGGRMQGFLQKADLYSLAANNCIQTYGPQRMLERGFDIDTQVCGGNLMKRVDSCQGDSGGPLQSIIITTRVSYRIVGVTSFGKDCGLVPGIYTRVSSYIPWIESIVWKGQV